MIDAVNRLEREKMDVKTQLEKEKMDMQLKYEAQLADRDIQIKGKALFVMVIQYLMSKSCPSELKSQSKNKSLDLMQTSPTS